MNEFQGMDSGTLKDSYQTTPMQSALKKRRLALSETKKEQVAMPDLSDVADATDNGTRLKE